MKPCAKNQKLIAWLAVDALDAPSAQTLRGHLESCAGCREYLAEMRRVGGRLADGRPTSDLRATASFHQAWLARVKPETATAANLRRAQTPLTLHESFQSLLRAVLAHGRLALSVAAILMVALWLGRGHAPSAARVRTVVRASVPVVTEADDHADLSPSFANYEQAASQSPDKLDELLARQEKHAARATPAPTEASLLDF